MEPFDFSNGISAFYIVSQFFALASLGFDLLAAQQKKKSMLLNMDTVAAFCSTMHYAFLGAWPGMLSKIVTTVRNAIAAGRAAHKRKNSKLLPLLFAAIYIIIGIFTFESVFSILPIIVPCVYAIVIYCCDAKAIRYAIVLLGIVWVVYDIYVSSIMGVVAQTIIILNGIIAIFRFRKSEKRSKK